MNKQFLEEIRKRGTPKNLYAAPKSMDNKAVDWAENDSTWYHWHGRIGRLRYVCYSLLATLPGALFIGGVPIISSSHFLTNPFVTKTVIFLSAIYLNIILAKRRLNDLNLPSWLCCINLLFYIDLILPESNNTSSSFYYVYVVASSVAMIFWLFLIFKRGSDDINNYGKPPRDNRKIHYIFPVLSIFITIAIITLLGLIFGIST